MGHDRGESLRLGLTNQLSPGFEVLLSNGLEQRLPFLGGVAKAEILEFWSFGLLAFSRL